MNASVPLAPYTVHCPSCDTAFPIDPAKVPPGGVPVICSACLRVFSVAQPDSPSGGESLEQPAPSDRGFENLTNLVEEALSEESPSAGGGGEGPGPAKTVASGAPRFGRRDPNERASRLARVLVSDIIAYHPERYRDSFARGTLQEDFQAEVDRSWKEYVDQVGIELAESTPYFQDALDEVLGQGRQHF